MTILDNILKIIYLRPILWTTSLLFVGCMTFTQKYEGVEFDTELNSKKCNNAPIQVSIIKQTNSEFGLSSHVINVPNQQDVGFEASISKKIIDRLRLGSFLINESKDKNSTYSIEFTLRTNMYENAFQKNWLLLSDITLFYLPSVTAGEYFIIATVKDKTGKAIEAVESSHVKFKWIQGLIVAPFFLVEDSLQDLELKYSAELANEIVAQILNKELICENK